MVSFIIILWVLLYGGVVWYISVVQAMNGLQVLIEDPYNSIAAYITASTFVLILVYMLRQCYYKIVQ